MQRASWGSLPLLQKLRDRGSENRDLQVFPLPCASMWTSPSAVRCECFKCGDSFKSNRRRKCETSTCGSYGEVRKWDAWVTFAFRYWYIFSPSYSWGLVQMFYNVATKWSNLTRALWSCKEVQMPLWRESVKLGEKSACCLFMLDSGEVECWHGSFPCDLPDLWGKSIKLFSKLHGALPTRLWLLAAPYQKHNIWIGSERERNIKKRWSAAF